MGFLGSQKQLEHFVDAHYEALYRYAYRLSGSAADAQDLTQETFCKAQSNLAQLRDPERAKPWLFSILRNAYLHRLRSEKQMPCVSLDGVAEVQEAPAEPPSDIAPEALQAALSQLSEEFRTPLILFYFEDFSYRDIAEQLNVPIGTVMSRLARGKMHLRGKLSRQTVGSRRVGHEL